MLSPLRYPGGKADFVSTLDRILRTAKLEGLPLIEPYAGSAAVTIGLLELGTVPTATILERDPLLFAFWVSVFERPEELLDRFFDLPMTLETWHHLQPLLQIDDPRTHDMVELGVAGLFFNRANFSGILHSGPIGGALQQSKYKINCRANKGEIAARVAQIAELGRRVTVCFGNGLDLIRTHLSRKRVVYYVDPPYFVMGERLYRYHFRHKDHKQLAMTLKKAKFPWVLSYDNNHVIEFLYEDCEVRKHAFAYSARSRKEHDELVIANFNLPEQLTSGI
jgi:DNA adenine methylase